MQNGSCIDRLSGLQNSQNITFIFVTIQKIVEQVRTKNAHHLYSLTLTDLFAILF